MPENVLPAVVFYSVLLVIVLSGIGFWIYSGSQASKAFCLGVQIWTAIGATLVFVIAAPLSLFYGFLSAGQNAGIVEVLMLTFLGALAGSTIAGVAGLIMRI
jgi:hypothetical protein